MNSQAKQWLKRILPSSVRAWWRRRNSLRFTGPYRSWAEATAAGGTYAVPDILERVAAATRAVVAGQAAYERDGLLFHVPASDPILLEELVRITSRRADDPLVVLDFGGSLGSTFHQHREFLDQNPGIRWHIVEQPHYVALGRNEFETGSLRFFPSIDEAVATGTPALVIASSVLPYLESPWPVIERLRTFDAVSWIISRTAFIDDRSDALFVQHVPPVIYPASYPLWALSQPRFENLWRERGTALQWHEAAEGEIAVAGRRFTFKTAVIRLQ
jgi:putative methyltransferase (TIGR04325 family)